MKTPEKDFSVQNKIVLLLALFIINGAFMLSAQEKFPNGKALNIPFRKYGLSIGNSYEFTGVRVNFADKDIKKINGLNVTFWINSFRFDDTNNTFNAQINGISLGVINIGGTMQPVNIGILGTGAGHNLNGISLGGLFVGAGGNINGISISGLANETGGNINGINLNGLWTEAAGISGIAFSGFALGADKVNGISFGSLVVGSGEINGISSSLVYLDCYNDFRGIGVTPGYLKSKTFYGIGIAGYSNTNKMVGLSIALYNRTDELHGLQVGLLNYAGNNKKGLRKMPLINIHLR